MFHSPNEAARAGAVLLDSQVPGWAEKVDLSALDVQDPNYCVLAQISGVDYDEGARQLNMTPGAAETHGFFVPGDTESASVTAIYNALTDAWAHEVRQRIAA